MSKIGRNDVCNCGSGLKYKKCCLNNVNDKYVNNKTSFFTQFSKEDQITTIALLKILPENHGKNIRLEEIQREVLKTNENLDIPLNYIKLREHFDSKYFYNHQEDPPENLFTENIMTPIGNKIVFSGVTEGQVYILQCLINTLSKEGLFDERFKNDAMGSALLLLTLSDQICKSFNYNRNQSFVETENNNIYIPSNDFLDDNKDKLIFSRKYIEVLCEKLNVDISIMNNFLLDIKSDDFLSIDPNKNPIIYKPLLEFGNNFIVVSPTNIVFSIVFNLYKLAKEQSCFDHLIDEYSKECWSQCNYILHKNGYKIIDFKFQETDLPIYEGLFVFDTNKLAYLTFQFDDGKEFNVENPLATPHETNTQEEIFNKRKLTLDNLINDKISINCEIFNLQILCLLGRPVFINSEYLDKNKFHLSLRMDELLILHKSGKINNLTLFNYAKASSEINLMTPFFLDNISMYINNEESFYLNDDAIPDFLIVAVGNALDFRTKATIKNDIHLGIYPFKNQFVHIPVEREKLVANLPIYRSSVTSNAFSNKILSTAFEREIWIEPLKNTNLKSDKNYFTLEICIAIAYWFYDLSSLLKPFISLRKIKPLVFKIDIIHIENIVDEFERINDVDAYEKIIYQIKDNEILINLDIHFYKALYRNDNLAEKILVKKILYILTQTLDSNNTPILNLEGISLDDFINQNIPLNQKKKILFQISDSDIRNNPKNLINYNRKISLYQINKQLDNLADVLGYKKELIFEGVEKENILKRIIDHFQSLIAEKLSKFKFEDVIRKLLILNESLIFQREKEKFQTIPKIECFKDYCEIEKIILEDIKSNSRISISVRCLIEYVTENPSIGTEDFSSEKLDETIALMSNIINWGTLYDEHIFSISNTKISILKSGRVGNSKEFRDQVIEPYYQEKFKEDMADYLDVFINKNFKLPEKIQTNEIHVKDEFELAFEDEFEISYDDFITVIFECIYYSFEKEGNVFSGRLNDIVIHLSKKLSIDFEKVVKIINLFTLKTRLDFDSSYFNSELEGNYPWRYNRNKSILQKPFIIHGDFLYFGSRSMYDFLLNIHNIIYTGRYNSEKPLMKSFLSRINFEKGEDFNNEVYDLLKNNKNREIIIEKEVTIGPKRTDIFKSNIDLGDIDILLIDILSKKIICIESKNTNFARTPYEMNREANNFIKKSGKGWIQKVEKREQFLKEKILEFNKFDIQTDFKDFQLEYIFITKEAIPLSYIKDVQYRFLTIYNLSDIDEKLFN